MSHLHRTIYMPWELLKAFSDHTGLFWSSIEIEGAICDAMAAAMKPQPAHAPAPPVDTANGYQWKQVFLPEGTVLRASFGREPYYAVVEGSRVMYGEFSLSPSAFANLQGCGNRNAWKAVWLRFPGFKDWVRADECRALRQTATARMFDPGPPDEPDKPAAKRVPAAGPYQQHYAETKPSGAFTIPMYELLQQFPPPSRASSQQLEAVQTADASEELEQCGTAEPPSEPQPDALADTGANKGANARVHANADVTGGAAADALATIQPVLPSLEQANKPDDIPTGAVANAKAAKETDPHDYAPAGTTGPGTIPSNAHGMTQAEPGVHVSRLKNSRRHRKTGKHHKPHKIKR